MGVVATVASNSSEATFPGMFSSDTCITTVMLALDRY